MVRHDKLDFLDAYKDDENYRKRKIECLEQNLDLVSAKLAYTNAKWGSLTRQYKQKVKKTQCVVCMDADANMSFVHGNTAHLACCEACAPKFNCRPATNADIFGESDITDDKSPP